MTKQQQEPTVTLADIDFFGGDVPIGKKNVYLSVFINRSNLADHPGYDSHDIAYGFDPKDFGKPIKVYIVPNQGGKLALADVVVLEQKNARCVMEIEAPTHNLERMFVAADGTVSKEIDAGLRAFIHSLLVYEQEAINATQPEAPAK